MTRRHCLMGNLPAKKIGRDWVIGEREVNAFAEKERKPGWAKQALATAQT